MAGRSGESRVSTRHTGYGLSGQVRVESQPATLAMVDQVRWGSSLSPPHWLWFIGRLSLLSWALSEVGVLPSVLLVLGLSVSTRQRWTVTRRAAYNTVWEGSGYLQSILCVSDHSAANNDSLDVNVTANQHITDPVDDFHRALLCPRHDGDPWPATSAHNTPTHPLTHSYLLTNYCTLVDNAHAAQFY